jgi:hypothetical protein
MEIHQIVNHKLDKYLKIKEENKKEQFLYKNTIVPPEL